MKIAIIEPYLVDYTGHYYNFVTELVRGFNEVFPDDSVDVFVPAACTINIGASARQIKVLPSINGLGVGNPVKKFLDNLNYFLDFTKALNEIQNDYDIIFFTTSDGLKLLLLWGMFTFKKHCFLYSHMFFSEKKQMIMLKFLPSRSDQVWILTPFREIDKNKPLIQSLRGKKFHLVLEAPYPFRPLERYNNYFEKSNEDFIISYLGPARREKGFIDFVEFIKFCRKAKFDYKFILQCNGAYEKDVIRKIVELKNEMPEQLEFIDKPLPKDEYEKAINRSSIILLLYSSMRYSGAISGILLEALYSGKPVIVRAGTWLANQIDKYGGGVVVDNMSLDNLRLAVEEIRSNYGRYEAEAFEAGKALSETHNGVELAKVIRSHLEAELFEKRL